GAPLLMRRPGRITGLLVLLCLLWPAAVSAQSWYEKLVMPGPLVEGHRKLETDCANCHSSFSQEKQGTQCADCHKPIAADQAAKTGFHGRAPEVQGQECRHCHTDHIGRDADIIGLDRETFDHNLTDYPLRGAHGALACDSCHASDKPFREAVGDCATCHKEDAPHGDKLGTECATCHQETGWADLKSFDHAKTGFELLGGHAKTPCGDCHVGEVWKGLSKTCADCHRLQDVHRSTMGAKCDSCHGTTKWQEVRFKHDTDTKFALTGAHAKAACTSCHTGDAYATDLPLECSDCHRDDDPHQGELGKACATCHTTEDWRGTVAFDHGLTRMPLIGLHVLTPCEECHIDQTFQQADISCASCHVADDPHKGTLGKDCESCHTPNGWAFWSFDHKAQTRFNLTGAHDGLVCRACHTPAQPDPAKVPRACVACHGTQDTHRGTFGRDCAACHITTNWKNVRLRR
ncbi:hypothetical protein, partial [Actibacterium sp.]|uniref:hypothetical protein n=1 Tax=Actibacterium sp. TaxID=1872125 RepID=UPI00356B0359